MQWSMGSTSCERCRRRPARPSASTAYCTRVRQAGTSPVASLSPGAGVDRAVPAGLLGGEPGQPLELLGDHLALEPALGAGRRRAASRSRRSCPGPAYGQGASTRSLDASSTSTASARRKRGVLVALGDLGDDPLAGQRVPDEEHPALVGAGDAVAAVGDRARPRPRTRSPDQRRGGSSAWRGGSRSDRVRRARLSRGDTAPRAGGSAASPVHDAGSLSAGRRLGLLRAAGATGPRRTEPGAFHSARRLCALLAASEDSSCQGTEVTMTPGREQQPALEPQRALVVQQVLVPVADHVLGDVDADHVARAVAGAAPLTYSMIGRVISRYGRVEDLQRHVDAAPLPLGLQRLGVGRVDVDAERFQACRSASAWRTPGRAGWACGAWRPARWSAPGRAARSSSRGLVGGGELVGDPVVVPADRRSSSRRRPPCRGRRPRRRG